MWIILKRGEKHRPGDQMCCGRESWYNPCNATWEAWDKGRAPNEIVRRELKGWEAVEYALRQEVLGNDVEGCQTTPLFWDCECEEDYITPYSEFGTCARCGAHDSRQPDSRIAEVIMKLIIERA